MIHYKYFLKPFDTIVEENNVTGIALNMVKSFYENLPEFLLDVTISTSMIPDLSGNFLTVVKDSTTGNILYKVKKNERESGYRDAFNFFSQMYTFKKIID